MPLHWVHLSAGSNMGNRMHHLRKAEEALHRIVGNVLRTSPVYQTAPWGCEHPTSFLNLVFELSTSLTPEALLSCLHAIEETAGRKKTDTNEYSPRPLDLDILFYDDWILQTPTLVLPHPLLHLRRFVLTPLNDLVPHLVHPVFRKTVHDLWVTCPDTGRVELI